MTARPGAGPAELRPLAGEGSGLGPASRAAELAAAGSSGDQGRGGLMTNLDLGSVDWKRLPARVWGRSRGSPSSGGTGRGRAVRHVPSGEGRDRGADSHGGEGRAPCGRLGGADPGGNIKQIFLPERRSAQEGGRAAVLRGRR